jgi:hypothetical protein
MAAYRPAGGGPDLPIQAGRPRRQIGDVGALLTHAGYESWAKRRDPRAIAHEEHCRPRKKTGNVGDERMPTARNLRWRTNARARGCRRCMNVNVRPTRRCSVRGRCANVNGERKGARCKCGWQANSAERQAEGSRNGSKLRVRARREVQVPSRNGEEF